MRKDGVTWDKNGVTWDVSSYPNGVTWDISSHLDVSSYPIWGYMRRLKLPQTLFYFFFLTIFPFKVAEHNKNVM